MRRSNVQFDYKSGFTALFSVLFWLASAFTGIGLRHLLPDFDGLPLFLLLALALTVACAANRTAAKVFARNHFGMRPEERREMYDRHLEECKRDPEAVLARYKDMEAVPLFMLILYFVLVFAIGTAAGLCLYENCDLIHLAAGGTGIMLTLPLGFMPIFRMAQQLPKPLNRNSLVPVGILPQLEAMAKKAADTAGVKGTIRLELTRDCDCDVNRFGSTYVVFLGTRLLTALTEEEVYQAMLSSFDFFARPKAYREILRRHRLGELGAADIRLMTCVFDWFFSYADVTLEWEYDLYLTACKLRNDRLSDCRIREAGDPAAAVSGMCKRAMWRYFVFEANELIPTLFYEPETPEHPHEWDVCHAFRKGLDTRHEAWTELLSKELRPASNLRYPTFRESWPSLLPDADAPSVSVWVPDLNTPYGKEVARALDMVEATIRQEITPYYEAARRREYLEPLAIVEAYEKDPTAYTTPELSPVINAYRDLGRMAEAEALCDTILETEKNPFAQAHAVYFKGMRMLHRYETEGIDLIYRAIDLNKNYMKDGFELVEEYCTMCGLADEYETFLRRAETQMSAHAANHEDAASLKPADHLIPEKELGDMLPDILSYMEKVSEGCIREIYLVRKVISEDFFSSVFVINFEYGAPQERMRRAYEAIFNYLDAYPVDWQFSLFLYDRETEAAVKRVEGSLVWQKKD
ncbi:MAG: hypothetical protein J6K29_03405 [Clostridia bacterium]|nr:hypothetical protein [Clostridia bacterium]